MSNNEPKWTIKLAEVAKFKFNFPLTRVGTQIAEAINLTQTKKEK